MIRARRAGPRSEVPFADDTHAAATGRDRSARIRQGTPLPTRWSLRGVTRGPGAPLRRMNLNHVTLIVSDFERSHAFYRSLGFEPITFNPPRYARFKCPGGDATLSIEVTGAPAAPPRAEIYFESLELDALCERLRARGVVFVQDPTDMHYLWREARLLDPDGHDLRLYFAGENRLDPPWRVGKNAG